MSFSPILLITFNRPAHTRRVLEAILSVKPQVLYVFQDGARAGDEDDMKKCANVRHVIEEMTGEVQIQLHTFFSDQNLGCGRGPSSAITWFFDNNEQGIILEDDCLPNKDFFYYCQELLDRYKDDPRIGFIGGSNYGYRLEGKASYGFGSGHHQTWGWASWRRAWNLFDYRLARMNEDRFVAIIKEYYKSIRQRDYWLEVFNKVKKDQMNNSCWDYQFYFGIWEKGMVAICPRVNLVSNVGFGEDATHTAYQNNALLDRSVADILPIIHPDGILHEYEMDDYLMRHFVIPYEYGFSGLKRLPFRINKKIKGLLGHQGPWLKKR